MPEPWTTERPKVLVVADDQDAGELLTRLLDRAGWRADLAYSAASGLSELDGAEYVALVVDLVDPGAGVEVLRSVRDDPGTRDLPVVLCSRHDSYGSEAWISGTDGFLVHPFEADTFVADLGEAITRPAEARDDHRQTQLGLSIPDAPA